MKSELEKQLEIQLLAEKLQRISGKKIVLKESDNPGIEFGGHVVSLEELKSDYPEMIFTLNPNPKFNKRYFARVDIKTKDGEKKYLGALKGPVTKVDALEFFNNIARSQYSKFYPSLILEKKKSKYKSAKDQIQNMKIPSELKERILSLINSGTRISDKHPIILGLTMAPELTNKIREKNLPNGFSFGADKNGFFIYTHRARCKSHENPESITQKEIKFIDSSG